MHPKPALSCVSTLYKSERFISEFVRRMSAAAAGISPNFEIVLVDDGSPDSSLAVALDLQSQYPNLRVVELSRNFGHHNAILAGLAAARGEKIFFVDSDLEEPPELIVQFDQEMSARGADVVFGFHGRKGQSALRKITGQGFWWMLGRLTSLPIQQNLANVRLMQRAYVEALLSMPDRNVFLGGMFAWPGFRQHAVLIERTERDGPSSYSWLGRVKLAWLAAVAFSSGPLFVVFGIGMIITLVSFLIGASVLLNKIVNPEAILDGFTSLMLSIWFLGGVLLGCVGVLGFYVAHIYEQARARPRYIVRAEHRGRNED